MAQQKQPATGPRQATRVFDKDVFIRDGHAPFTDLRQLLPGSLKLPKSAYGIRSQIQYSD